jgi:SAM-dependent methyltransferase
LAGAAVKDRTDTWLYWYWGKENQPEPQIIALIELFKRKKVSSVLDLGCGTGRHSLFFARNGFKVFGFDQSSAAIKRAEELSEEQKLKINFKVWDMLRIPYPYGNQSFDAVVATKVVHHTTVTNISLIFGEIRRILKDEGVLFLEVPERNKIGRLEAEGVKHRMIEEGTFVPLSGEEEGVPHHYFTREELRSMFSEYSVLNLEILKEHYCLTASRVKKEK